MVVVVLMCLDAVAVLDCEVNNVCSVGDHTLETLREKFLFVAAIWDSKILTESRSPAVNV